MSSSKNMSRHKVTLDEGINSSTRPLGQLRVTGKGAPTETQLLKLPPVEIYPSRSFEDTFVRGLQVGKPAVVNASTQVNQAQILNCTPEPHLARPTPETRNTRVMASDHKAVNAVGNAYLTPSVYGRDSENRFWDEEIMEMRNHVQELLGEIDDLKDEAEASKSKVVEMEERARGAEEEKEQLQSQVHKLETDYDFMVEKLITENEKLEVAQERLSQLEPLEEEVKTLRKENSELREKVERAEETERAKIEQIEKKHVNKIAEVRLEIEKEMFFKDDKIEKLKKALEALLGQKSNERQKQLDDMVRNFAKLQNETEILKAKLKHYEDKSKTSCHNCGRLSYKLEEKISQLLTKEKQVNQFQEQNNHLRSQLVDQDKRMDRIIEDRAIEKITVYK